MGGALLSWWAAEGGRGLFCRCAPAPAACTTAHCAVLADMAASPPASSPISRQYSEGVVSLMCLMSSTTAAGRVAGKAAGR